MNNLMELSVKCVVCDKEAVEKCTGCGNNLYCSKLHKKEHLELHKINCKPYIIAKNDILGRYLIASKDIKAGEIILREKPCIIGPRLDNEPLCYNCYMPIYSPLSFCTKCSLVFICQNCKNEKGHSEDECNIFANASKNLQKKAILSSTVGQFIVPLRCILKLKKTTDDPGICRLIDLESHTDQRRGTTVWHCHYENVVKKLNILGVTSMSEEDVEFVQKICGIVDVNSFEVRGPVGSRCTCQPLRGLYVEAALMAHDCVPNTHLSIDEKFEMVIHASINIPKGQSIVYNYTSPLQRTEVRRLHLKEGKYFDCNCQRCLDPTELGTHMSSLKCLNCAKGLINQSGDKNNWSCINCKQTYRKELISDTVKKAEDILMTTDHSDLRALEKNLDTFLGTFAPNHSIVLDIKQKLVALYREVGSTTKVLQRKILLCKEILNVLNVIEPGISRLKGITHYEIHAGLVGLAQSEKCTNEELKLYIEAEGCLREAITHLLYEPFLSPEGNLQRNALAELKVLREIIQDKRIFFDERSNKNSKPKGKAKKNKK